ncbi:hypothetical protein SCD_n01286 [Sulfuricella denitrificans skB26]|uniref:Uncharacterized protein n=1 Tax=Sulfuricella denitrificans (strain DSM 22764 / NBRC 105220 / skB26) TaxID=1163617 RepID=S6AA24_SULDS|nr:DUF58 domain-containing protein [Sulfuricella denitrificans]BAN35115.1 hypothetical protein SCD_n01286 [Sulfuricella denitrificans skB26]
MTFRLFNHPVWRRIFNRIDVEQGPIILDRQRIFILPTRHGLVFAAVLLLMLVGSINYSLSLGFVLTFLLGAMALVSILHTYRNLAQLTISAGKTMPVFAGQQASFTLCLTSSSKSERYAIGMTLEKPHPQFVDVPADETVTTALELHAPQRGILRLGRFTLFTRFPLGLFQAWSKLDLDMNCIVYPQPDTAMLPQLTGIQGRGDRAIAAEGSEDFRGMRPYHTGDSLRHVAWKAMAQGRGMLTKQFSGQALPELWLDWDDLAGMSTEPRLSRLCRWVLDAQIAGLSYGLRIPGSTLAPDNGEVHQRTCLEALALFGIKDL